MTSAVGVAPLAGLRYGALGLPLAFVALPLYVYMPAYYASQFGASLAALGTVLLLVRIFDAVTDPLMGYAADHLLSTNGLRRMLAMGLGCVVLWLGFLGLFFPPAAMQQGNGMLVWCATMLVVAYLAYSALSITHQAWAARLQGGIFLKAVGCPGVRRPPWPALCWPVSCRRWPVCRLLQPCWGLLWLCPGWPCAVRLHRWSGKG